MADETLDKPLTRRFTRSVAFACKLHRKHPRKGTQIPYVSHLLGVASIALEYGATEDEAIAAILHDALEDHPRGGATGTKIRHKFGGAVLKIVQGCSDTEVIPKPPWRKRKKAYIAHVRKAPISVRLVSASDKLHNARAVLADYRVHGEALWDRFNGGRETLWYYRALVKAFAASKSTPSLSLLVGELDRVVSELERVAAKRKPVRSGASKPEARRRA